MGCRSSQTLKHKVPHAGGSRRGGPLVPGPPELQWDHGLGLEEEEDWAEGSLSGGELFHPIHCAGCTPEVPSGGLRAPLSPSRAGTLWSCLCTTHLIFLCPWAPRFVTRVCSYLHSCLKLLGYASFPRAQLWLWGSPHPQHTAPASVEGAGLDQSQEPKSTGPPNHCEPS